MATRQSKSSASSASIASSKDKENETLCMVCFQTWAVDIVRHTIDCKELYPARGDRRKLGIRNAKLFRRACAKMGPSLFFSEAEFKKKERYTPYEVAELLQSMGHCAVPEEFEDVYVRRPVYNNLTDRNLGKEVEDDNKTRQIEIVKAKELQKRRAANVKH